MDRIRLLNGIEIESIGFGTYKLTDELTGGRAKEIMKQALNLGYRYIDTAAFYKNEAILGEAIKESGISRKELTLQSKVWKGDLGYEKTAASVDASMARLQVEHIDLMLIHWPVEFPGDPDWKTKVQGSYKALEDALKAGKIGAIGLSNFLPHHIMAINEVKTVNPVLDQLELHAGYMQQYAVDYCRANNIQLQAWSPLGRMRVVNHPTIQRLAQKYQVKPAHLLLRFLLQQGIAVIPKASSVEHMKDNREVPVFTISEEDMSVLLTLPPVGWAGEHPDFDREAVDNRYC